MDIAMTLTYGCKSLMESIATPINGLVIIDDEPIVLPSFLLKNFEHALSSMLYMYSCVYFFMCSFAYIISIFPLSTLISSIMVLFYILEVFLIVFKALCEESNSC